MLKPRKKFSIYTVDSNFPPYLTSRTNLLLLSKAFNKKRQAIKNKKNNLSESTFVSIKQQLAIKKHCLKTPALKVLNRT